MGLEHDLSIICYVSIPFSLPVHPRLQILPFTFHPFIHSVSHQKNLEPYLFTLSPPLNAETLEREPWLSVKTESLGTWSAQSS